MHRFKQIDASNSSIGALLFHDEEVVSLQDSVGLYDGKEKTLHQNNGTVYLTSHRLLYVDDLEPHRYSCSLHLSLVKQTEYYAGFLKSSPKITLTLAKPELSDDDAGTDSQRQPSTSAQRRPSPLSSQLEAAQPSPSSARNWRITASAADSTASDAASNWICAICGFSNAFSRGACDLCGVTKEPARPTPTRTPVPERTHPSEANRPYPTPAPSIPKPSEHVATPQKSSESEGIACPVCTFFNHPSMNKCEICGSNLGNWQEQQPSSAPASTTSLTATSTISRKSVEAEALSLRSSLPTSRSSTPASAYLPAPTDSIKLSFRKGGDKAFYNLFKSTLKAKAWASNANNGAIGGGSTANTGQAMRVAAGMVDLDGRSAALKRVGIDGILSSVDSTSRAQNDDMQGALKDLEALMRKAKQMVEFAESLNAKLTKQEEAAAAARRAGLPNAAAPQPDQEAATLIRSSLVQLGLPAPAVTEDMTRDQEEYHRELARELAGLLLGNPSAGQRNGLMGAGQVAAKDKGLESLPRVADDALKGRGLVGLDEVWCVWNRARGVALIPPQALRAAAAYLPDITSPSVRIKTFKSGLSVLHTPRYSDDAFAARILHFLDTLEWEHKMKRIEQAQSLRISDNKAEPGSIDASGRAPEEVSYGDNLSPWGAGASILEIAEREDVPILLINEMIEMIETKTGMVVRDDGGSNGTRWFVNHFSRVTS